MPLVMVANEPCFMYCLQISLSFELYGNVGIVMWISNEYDFDFRIEMVVLSVYGVV